MTTLKLHETFKNSNKLGYLETTGMIAILYLIHEITNAFLYYYSITRDCTG